MYGSRSTMDWISEALGMREPSAFERMQRGDWRGYSRGWDGYDSTSALFGLVVGLGVGIGLGYALKGNVAPTVRNVRERAYGAIEGIQDRLPERLRITRMDEAHSEAASGS